MHELRWQTPVPYEIKVRAAEAIVAGMDKEDVDEEKRHKLSDSSDWHDRLVAGWAVRNRDGSVAEKIRNKLSNEDFSDDNGYYLVREAVKIYQ